MWCFIAEVFALFCIFFSSGGRHYHYCTMSLLLCHLPMSKRSIDLIFKVMNTCIFFCEKIYICNIFNTFLEVFYLFKSSFEQLQYCIFLKNVKKEKVGVKV
jgi:hypothetical protein